MSDAVAPDPLVTLLAPRVRAPGWGDAPGEGAIGVGPGRSVSLLGRSGTGKSLLARLVLGQVPRAPLRTTGTAVTRSGGGEVRVDLARARPGTDLPALAALRGVAIGYVPQGGRENLVPCWTVAEHFQRVDGRTRAGVAPDPPPRTHGPASWSAALDDLGVDPSAVLPALPVEISEGTAQRVLLALALHGGARTLVLDEPTAGLDPGSRATTAALLARVTAERDLGLLLVTHDLPLATRLSREFHLVHEGALAGRVADLAAATGDLGRLVAAARELEVAWA